jgi:hypothetical protein
MNDDFLRLYPGGYIMGGLTNGMIVLPDKRVIFLPYDPMRQFRQPKEIAEELQKLMEGK